MNYIIICLQDDSLDPSYYVLAFEIFNNLLYKSSRTKLKLITNINKYLIVKNSIYKKIIMISYWYIKTNNLKYLNYNSSKLKIYIIYENINAIYLNTII